MTCPQGRNPRAQPAGRVSSSALIAAQRRTGARAVEASRRRRSRSGSRPKAPLGSDLCVSPRPPGSATSRASVSSKPPARPAPRARRIFAFLRISAAAAFAAAGSPSEMHPRARSAREVQNLLAGEPRPALRRLRPGVAHRCQSRPRPRPRKGIEGAPISPSLPDCSGAPLASAASASSAARPASARDAPKDASPRRSRRPAPRGHWARQPRMPGANPPGA